MSNFRKFEHVERLDRADTEGILEGKCYISFKLDGTNSSVWINENGNICAGSRNRELSLDKDNAGFCRWVNSNDEEAIAIRIFLQENPSYIIYGEFLGNKGGKFVGSIKNYNPDALGKLWIFDIYNKDTRRYSNPIAFIEMLSDYNLSQYCIPQIEVMNPTEEYIRDIAKNNHFLLPEDKVGEGVVIRNMDFINKYGHYTIGKLVLDEFKQEKSKPKKEKTVSDNIEQDIIDAYILNSELSKSKAKVCVIMDIAEFDIRNGQCIGRMMNLVFNDLLEECKNWVKDFRNPTVDFAKLKRACDTKVRNYLGL